MSDTAVVARTLTEKLEAARVASRTLATLTAGQKNQALHAIASSVRENAGRIIPANELDLANGREKGLSAGLQDRLRLTEDRLSALASAVEQIAGLVDPVGEAVRGKTLPNGLQISQVRVPFGVVGAIYEARPNVTIDIAALALKSGNAVVLRGGSAAENTNRVLVELIQQALTGVGLPAEAVQTIDEFGRDGAKQLMQARGFVDVLVPRGSADLINTVVRESQVPVIETGAGVVHIFIDESANKDWAVDIVRNAKVQRPSVCNAVETVLVHRAAAERLLPGGLAGAAGTPPSPCTATTTRCGCSLTRVPATEEDWSTEYMSLDVVGQGRGLPRRGDRPHPPLFHRPHGVDHHERPGATANDSSPRSTPRSSWSTRRPGSPTAASSGSAPRSASRLRSFTRAGPMGLSELTSTKWVVRGSGQVRA